MTMASIEGAFSPQPHAISESSRQTTAQAESVLGSNAPFEGRVFRLRLPISFELLPAAGDLITDYFSNSDSGSRRFALGSASQHHG